MSMHNVGIAEPDRGLALLAAEEDLASRSSGRLLISAEDTDSRDIDSSRTA